MGIKSIPMKKGKHNANNANNNHYMLPLQLNQMGINFLPKTGGPISSSLCNAKDH